MFSCDGVWHIIDPERLNQHKTNVPTRCRFNTFNMMVDETSLVIGVITRLIDIEYLYQRDHPRYRCGVAIRPPTWKWSNPPPSWKWSKDLSNHLIWRSNINQCSTAMESMRFEKIGSVRNTGTSSKGHWLMIMSIAIVMGKVYMVINNNNT